MEGTVQYKTDDITPVYWFHYTPTRWSSPSRAAQEFPGFREGGEGAARAHHARRLWLNSANHAAHERLDATFGIRRPTCLQGTGDMTTAVIAAMSPAPCRTPPLRSTTGQVRALIVRWSSAILLPDVPTFRELGIDWVDGAFRASACEIDAVGARGACRNSGGLNADPEMKELAAKSGFELVNVGVDRMDAS